MTVPEFLTTFVEGYLFEDLHSMANISPPSGKIGGGVAYPMMAAALAGVELFGGLMSSQTFSRYAGSKYFGAFWGRMYRDQAALADAVYNLARHGLAHQFLARICVVKRNGESAHLKYDESGALVLDAIVLADDLERTYHAELKPLANSPEVASRLKEMADQYRQQAADFTQAIRTLGPVARPLDGPTGSPFVPNSPSGFSKLWQKD